MSLHFQYLRCSRDEFAAPKLKLKQKYKRKKNQFQIILDFINSWYHKCANNFIFSKSFV